MARIRSIKPEFPQSESMGNVSRDARLLFVLLWTVADDSGITRGNSRMLASLLFPYDDDAPSLIDGWMEELERENCIVRYKHEGSSYLQILNWLIHQKIDKPTPSKLPSFDSSREDSRILPLGEERKGEEGKGIKAMGNSKPVCPHQEIIALYHEILPASPTIRDWTPARASALKARWSESADRQSLDYWRKLFEYIAGIPFLTGKVSGNGRKPFVLSLDWLVKAENFAKVREGRYEDQAA